MNIGYILINSEQNLSGLKPTISALTRYHLGDAEIVHVLPKDADLKKYKEICHNSYKGQNTVTSLINVGFKKLKSEWGMVLIVGSIVKARIYKKYELFNKSDKDIFYPLVDHRYGFVDASINGLTINRAFFNEIGNFPENEMWKSEEAWEANSFELCKLLWSMDAEEKGCIFKAILGCKIF